MIHAAIHRYRPNYSYHQTLAKACYIPTTPINVGAAILLHSRKRHFAPAVSCPAAHLIGSACKTHKHDWLSHTHLHRSSTPTLSPTCPLRSPSPHHPQHSSATADHQGRLLQALSHAPPTPALLHDDPRGQTSDYTGAKWAPFTWGRPGCRSGRVLAATTTGHATWHNIRPSKAATTVASPPMARPPLLPPSAMPLSPTSLGRRRHRHQEEVRR